MRVCGLEGCTNKHNAKGLCLTHYYRLKRHGNFEKPVRKMPCSEGNPNWRGDLAAYMTVHSRLQAEKGPASAHQCVDCEGRAKDWAFTYTCTDPKGSRFGPYSTDLKHYQPMCRQCHRRFDYKAGLVSA